MLKTIAERKEAGQPLALLLLAAARLQQYMPPGDNVCGFIWTFSRLCQEVLRTAVLQVHHACHNHLQPETGAHSASAGSCLALCAAWSSFCTVACRLERLGRAGELLASRSGSKNAISKNAIQVVMVASSSGSKNAM